MSMGTNELLRTYPLEKNNWTGKVTFSLGYPRVGWVTMAIHCTAYQQAVFVYCSYVFDPFPALLHWLENIANGNLPCEFSIDEEGEEKIFRAKPVNEEEFIFEIGEWPWEEEEEQPLYMYVKASRKQFISEFLKRWDEFVTYKRMPSDWSDTDPATMDVSVLRKFVEG